MLVFSLESGRGAGGTERATEGGLLGGALEGARATGGFVGEDGVDLSSLYTALDEGSGGQVRCEKRGLSLRERDDRGRPDIFHRRQESHLRSHLPMPARLKRVPAQSTNQLRSGIRFEPSGALYSTSCALSLPEGAFLLPELLFESIDLGLCLTLPNAVSRRPSPYAF